MTVTTEKDLITNADSAPAMAGTDATPGRPDASAADLVEEDLLVEDVSIDGMCGVY
jgi:mycofactocin precursor